MQGFHAKTQREAKAQRVHEYSRNLCAFGFARRRRALRLSVKITSKNIAA
jgi:hypothetical protein